MGSTNALVKEAKRLFHGRGQNQNYNIDYFPPYVVVDSFVDFDEAQKKEIITKFPEAEGVFYRNRKKREEFTALAGKIPSKHLLIENDLKYEISFEGNQNIGFFMDMKPGRELIQNLSKDKTVLNLFSYTCSFSVAAKAGGCKKVVNVDMKKSFLKTGERNHQLNNLSGNVQYLSYEIMKSLSGLQKKGPWDIIVVDPPSQQKSFNLEKDYPKLLKRASDWLSSGGHLLACINSPFHQSEFLINNCPDLKVSKVLYGAFEEADLESGLKMVLFEKPKS
ncbi:MAG: SAM-dependent methyltransferase [Halobacteriovorax sp.]|nr:SAM-dependent methyltransferase [Halobacteriovorax sp.]|tara:strand:- start:9287 stop:10120 length:834 start_codon:yes stop_codon:yes gene_type:complete